MKKLIITFAIIISFLLGWNTNDWYYQDDNLFDSYLKAKDERDILSDAIRYSIDEGDTIILRNTEYYLDIISLDTCSLEQWSFCY